MLMTIIRARFRIERCLDGRHLRANLAIAEKGPLPSDLYEEAKRRLETALTREP